jgi:hypothetical protein
VSQVKPARVRYYFDANLLGVAKVLVNLRPDVTYPGDPGGVVFRRQRDACPITSPDVPDRSWIPVAAANHWLIITRDRQIQHHIAELNAVVEAKARMVAITASDAMGTFSQLEVIMSQWRAMEDLLNQPGPFIYSVTRTTLTRLEAG